MGNIYLTPEGFEKIRKEISKEIGRAREHGDISENAEYDAAKEAQGLNEKKISELEQKLSSGKILDDEKIPKDEALIGATVTLKDLDSGETFEYTLVSELEGDISNGKMSVAAPVGKALLGHKKNETVEITVPAGILHYKILKIERT